MSRYNPLLVFFSPSTIRTQGDRRVSDSQSNRHQDNFALESSGSGNSLESSYEPVTASSSRHPSISLPAQDFLSTATLQQTTPNFSLPVRGRNEPQIQNRRVSVTAFGNSSSTASHLATSVSESWYSQEGYEEAVAQFQARRSRSQPPRPGQGTGYSQPQPFQGPVTMSAFAPILPSPSSHFGPSNDFFSSSMYSPHLGFDSVTALPDQSLFGGAPDQRPSTISPRLLPSTHSYGMSTPRTFSKAVSRSPPLRERTPIRHHRPSISRARSGSRPEALLAYAEHQQQQQQMASAMHLQSAPNTPPVYPPSAYSMPTTTPPTASHSGYYTTPTLSHSASQYLTAPSTYASDQNQTSYFGLTRSVSQPTLELGTLNPQDAIYLPNPIPSTSPPLPSLSSNLHSFPPPAASLESSPEGFRVLASRPKPQCFDHGCNGRQFSTFSNLLRHQREKSGSAMKAVCPHCGTEFTRTTARNGHLWGGKCKGRGGGDGQQHEGKGDDAPSPAGSE